MTGSRALLGIALLVAGSAAGQSRAASPHGPTSEFLELKDSFEDPSQGWQSLFDGNDLSHWKALQDPGRDPKPFDWDFPVLVILDPENPRQLKRASFSRAAGVAPAFVNNLRGKSDNPVTKRRYRDVELYIEFMVPEKSNSGICLMGLYEIQIRDSYGNTALKYGDNGGIYARFINERRVGGEPPKVNVSRRPGEWESFHIWFKAPVFDERGRKIENARFLRVEHNGTLIHDEYELTGSTRGHSPWPEQAEAPLLLQGDHGPVAFRNIYIRPLPKP
jgi:hypothetical protein